MDTQAHWETIYSRKAADAVSWYAPHLARSLELILRASASRSAAILDAGGGQSTLAGDLVAAGFDNISVLDISGTAIEANRKRLGILAGRVRWIVADIAQARLEPASVDIWHDRALFHFLTDSAGRAAYVRQVEHALSPGGHVILATFGPQGPAKCSGLDVVRYDAVSLQHQFGPRFRLEESFTDLHQTPLGTAQQFLFCRMVRELAVHNPS